MTSPKEIIGLDVGVTMIGMARASSIAKLPEPLLSLPTKKVLAKLKEYMRKGNIEAIVVGLPRNLQGQDTPQTKWVRNWVKNTKAEIDTPFFWQDEAMTSREAADKLLTSNFKNQTMDEHAVAAAIILQDFLSSPEEQRLRC